jgi:hypothetical protein
MCEILGVMHSIKLRFGVLALALLCTACGSKEPQQTIPAVPAATGWSSYNDLVTGVTLSYPNNFTIEPTEDTQIAEGDTTYVLKQLRLRKVNDNALISVLKSDNRALLLSLTRDRALQKVTIAGKEYRKFVMEGAGSPLGYVLSEEPPVVIAFSYLDDQALIDQVMASVVVSK